MESQIWNLALAGDEFAIEAVVADAYRTALAGARRRFNSQAKADLAEDAAQEAALYCVARLRSGMFAGAPYEQFCEAMRRAGRDKARDMIRASRASKRDERRCEAMNADPGVTDDPLESLVVGESVLSIMRAAGSELVPMLERILRGDTVSAAGRSVGLTASQAHSRMRSLRGELEALV